MPKLELKDDVDLKAVLEHVRSQFQYHARQRLESIRYFFAALAVFSVAYVSAHAGKASASGGIDSQSAPTVPLVLSLTALLVTLAFWALDYRNAQLVQIDELAVREIERQVAMKYGLVSFEAVAACEKPGQLRRYGNVMKFIFGYFTLLFAVVLVWDMASIALELLAAYKQK